MGQAEIRRLRPKSQKEDARHALRVSWRVEAGVCLSETQGEAGQRSVDVKARRTWNAESVMCWVSLR